MSIRDKRYTKIVNTIIREELQKGNLPTSREFIGKLNQKIMSENLNGPKTNFTPRRKGATARANEHNQILDDTYQDLETLYESVIEQHDKAGKNFDKFEVEKSKLDYQLNDLEEKLKELILLYGQEGYLNSVYDIFTDFTKIDTAETDANIDIAKHEVRISDVKNRSKKLIVPMKSQFEILSSIRTQVELSPISGVTNDVLLDKTNRTWQVAAMTKEKMDVAGLYYVEFQNVQEMNRITLETQSIKPAFIKIEFTTDNLNWSLLPYYEQGVTVKNQYTFDFPTVGILKLRFMIGKNEPDSDTLVETGNGEMRYSYIFGLKNISFYTFHYALEASVVSNVLDAQPDVSKNFTIDKVSLHVEEELPNGTEIKYFIAIPEKDQEPEWKALSPINRETPQYDQIIDFKNIATSVPTSFYIDPNISIGEYEMENLYANGINFYKVGEIENRQIIQGTEKLFIGKNSWSMKSYSYQQPNHAVHMPSIQDWMRPANIVTESYLPIEDGKPGLLLNKRRSNTTTNYMFTLGVFSEKEKELVVSVPTSIDPIAVYLNGNLIYEGIPNATSQVSYIVQSGWNEIIVLVYDRNSVGTVNGATVDINVDFRKHGSNVYAKAKALTKVSLFDLRYNVLNTDNEKYALQTINGKTYVITNYIVPGLRYEFYYNYVDGAVKDEILFKAVLSRDEMITENSPKLKSYRLRFS